MPLRTAGAGERGEGQRVSGRQSSQRLVSNRLAARRGGTVSWRQLARVCVRVGACACVGRSRFLEACSQLANDLHATTALANRGRRRRGLDSCPALGFPCEVQGGKRSRAKGSWRKVVPGSCDHARVTCRGGGAKGTAIPPCPIPSPAPSRMPGERSSSWHRLGKKREKNVVTNERFRHVSPLCKTCQCRRVFV